MDAKQTQSKLEVHGAGGETKGGWSNWLPFILGLLIAVSFLEYVRATVFIKLEDAALGRDTKNLLGDVDGVHFHCLDARDAQACYRGYEVAGKPPAILWLGNSQLAAVNRVKTGDKTASTVLYSKLLERGYFLTTFSQPNANLFEHAVAYSVVAGKLDTRLLILPVVLDDIRELGIRRQVAQFFDDDDVALERLRMSELWPLVSPNLAAVKTGETSSKKLETLQGRFEAGFNEILGTWSPLWDSRLAIKGFSAASLHHFRNKVLGINARTKRKVSANVYRAKMKALEAILKDARKRHIRVLLYIPPYRTDIDGPYVAADYALLKRDAEEIAGRYGATFADIDTVVPGPEWATVVHPVYGFEDDDFMHFTAAGHRRLAAAIDKVLLEMGF